MTRPVLTCVLGLVACAACIPSPESAAPELFDVSGDDCTASLLVFSKPPSQRTEADPGIPFVNDGCSGDRIFLGVEGTRRELKRREDLPLGTGGEYSDGEYRVLVTRVREVSRRDFPCPPDAPCEPGEMLHDAVYEAQVRIWSGSRSWTIAGTLVDGTPW
jgi:hypothetical protein